MLFKSLSGKYQLRYVADRWRMDYMAPAAFKARRICVIYSHNNWYIKRGQANKRKEF